MEILIYRKLDKVAPENPDLEGFPADFNQRAK